MATTPLSLDLGAGVLIGFGLSGCSFNLVSVRLQQTAAAGAARHRARRRNGCRLVRAIPVCAVRRRHDRQFRLAVRAFGVCRPDAADPAAVAGALDAAHGGHHGRARRRPAIVQDGAGGSVRASFLCASGARLLHLRFSARLHHGAFARLSFRSGHTRIDRRLGSSRRSACSTSSVRSASAGCRTCFRSATSCR